MIYSQIQSVISEKQDQRFSYKVYLNTELNLFCFKDSLKSVNTQMENFHNKTHQLEKIKK